jgi:hypothetical protein
MTEIDNFINKLREDYEGQMLEPYLILLKGVITALYVLENAEPGEDYRDLIEDELLGGFKGSYVLTPFQSEYPVKTFSLEKINERVLKRIMND